MTETYFFSLPRTFNLLFWKGIDFRWEFLWEREEKSLFMMKEEESLIQQNGYI